jgi:hypothetical protein
LIALAELCHFNDASGQYFPRLIRLPIEMKSSPGGLQ